MKKAISIFAALLMLLSIVSIAFAEDAATEGTPAVEEEPAVVAEQPEVVVVADEAAAQEIIDEETLATPEVVEEAGVTPDQTVLWTVEQVVEDVDVALTLDDAEAAEKSLEYADERLAEAQVMAEENNTEAVEDALEAQEENIIGAEESAAEISEEDPAAALQIQVEIQGKFQAQYEHTAAVKAAILTRMQSKWSPEKYAKISANFDKMLAKHKEVKTKLDAKEKKTKTKLSAKTGKSSEEVENITGEIKTKAREERQVKPRVQTNKEIEPVEAEETEPAEDAEDNESVDIGAGIVKAKGNGKH